MKTKLITLKLINSFKPCYNPTSIGVTDEMSFTPLEFIAFAKDKVQGGGDLIWLLCRSKFMSDKDMRLFAVWCAKEVLKLIPDPDPRSVNTCNVAEKFANGEATELELRAARVRARVVYGTAAGRASADAAYASAEAAGRASAEAADAADNTRNSQIEQLKTYF